MARFKVDEGTTLQSFLKKKLDLPLREIKRLIDDKHCRVGGVVAFISTKKLSVGDSVEVDLKRRDLTLNTLYEEEEFLVVDKPAGLVCTKENLGFDLVHRLDKETSGVLILAKTSEMKKAFEDLFYRREMSKCYLAIVEGALRKDAGQIDNEHGSSAWEVMAKTGGHSLVKVFPKTGRTHQIRLHMKKLGAPILGDTRYGRASRARRHMLHAYKIAFFHPKTGKRIEVCAKLPSDMRHHALFNR